MHSSPRAWSLACFVACGLALSPSEAAAFCGFYVAGADAKLFNDATVVVLMRDGTRTVLSMQNNYQGPAEAFALVIPVPVVLQEGDVKILRDELFERVELLASPRLVEYWEADPCADPVYGGRGGGGGVGMAYGIGSGAGFGGRSTVTIEAQFAVGEYEIVILSASESSGLDQWLRDNDYNIPAGAEPLLRPYIAQGMKFFVAKVDPDKVSFDDQGRTKLSALRFHYDSQEFVLPVRLGLLNAPDPSGGGKQDLLIHVLAPGTRYQAANYPNVTIPTNLDLEESARSRFGQFYVSLFDHTLAQHPGAVVTEYAWMAGVCDPCPGPDAALTNQELLELGGDVLPSWSNSLSTQQAPALPDVQHGTPTVGPGLHKDVIRRIVRAHINEVRSCYNQALTTSPGIRGEVSIQFTIGASGEVSEAVVAETTLPDAALTKCIAKAVERWTFPQPTGGAEVTVSYPFTLTPGAGGSALKMATPSNFVLTRLHARYDASSLGEDLVFEAAEPIVGGREFYGRDGKLEQGATVQRQGTNNFQARYAIRHAWADEIQCESPVRGIWTSPPTGEASPTVARQLAAVPRGASLAGFVGAEASRSLGLGEPASRPAPEPELEPATADPSPPKAAKSGCACSLESSPTSPVGAAIALLALLGFRRRSPKGRG